MSVTKNVFRLNKVYDLIVDGQWVQYNSSADPGELYVWGNNATGRLGDNTVIPKSSPIQIPGTQWVRYASTYSHTIARKSDGSLWAWGNNANGRLGDDTVINKSSPIQIPGTSWSSSTASYSFSLALKDDNTLWVWGYNHCGQLGQNNILHRSSPVQVPGTSWCAATIGGAGNSGFGLKTDGTLWAWGGNNSGALGINTSIARYSSPVQIPGTSWQTLLRSDSDGMFAVKTDNTVWGWGLNNLGQVGDNTVINRSSPVQIPGPWSCICGLRSASIGLKTDGTLWSWGRNSYGQLGQSNIIHRSSPVQIPGSSWRDIGAGTFQSFASKTDGTLWSWGYGSYGRLGLNDVIHRSSPTQIPGNWVNPFAGGASSGAMKSP